MNKQSVGPRELTGAVDLIHHYKLLAHHDFFCKRSLPLAISETHYLHNVVGDTEIRKGEGMELDQLFHDTFIRETNAHIEPFDLDTLRQAFQLRETAPIDLPSVSILPQWLLLVFLIASTRTSSSAMLNYRQKRGFPPLVENRKMSPKTRRGSIRSTRTEIRKRTRSTRSVSVITRIGVKTKIRKRRRTKVGTMIPVLTTQRSIMIRFACCYLFSKMEITIFIFISL